MVGSTPAAPGIPSWQRTVTSTERTRTTSSLTDSEIPGTTELSDSKEQSVSKVSSLEYSSMNGMCLRDFFIVLFYLRTAVG